jgi:hypothetical protein
MSDKIQANLDPKTVERIAKLADSRKTRGIDKMINECLDNMQEVKRNCGEPQEVEGESESE